MIKKVFFLCFLFLAIPLSAQQSQKGKDLQNQRENLEADIRFANELLKSNKKTISNAMYRLSLIDKQIDSRKKLISVLNSEIDNTNKEIRLKELAIASLEKELKTKKESYANSIRKMYSHQRNQDKLLFILSSENFSQSYRRILYLREYSSWLKTQGAEIAEKQTAVTAEKAQLQQTLADKQELMASQKQEYSQLAVQETERKAEIKSLEGERKHLQADIKQKQKRANELNAQIKKIIAEEAKAEAERLAKLAAEAEKMRQKDLASQNAKKSKSGKKQSGSPEPAVEPESSVSSGYDKAIQQTQKLSADFAANKGRLPMPVKGKYAIVSSAGLYIPDVKGNVKLNRDWIEIQTSPGSMAHAVFDGVVVAVAQVPGSNLGVVLNHGEYTTVYTNLSEVVVKKGDKVGVGQTLGTIFCNRAEANQTILEFQLWRKQVALNPEQWLRK